jgi:hypothetical protein
MDEVISQRTEGNGAGSRRNEGQGFGGIGFEQLRVKKGGGSFKLTLSCFSKAPYSLSAKTISLSALSQAIIAIS